MSWGLFYARRSPALTASPQAWCLVQVAHTLCCPGVMFTAFDDSRVDRVQTAQTQTLAVGVAPAEPAERV